MYQELKLPPSLGNDASRICLCGNQTTQYHEYMFCSTDCALLDSLRSLDDPESHYRGVVRKAYDDAGIAELYPRHVMSVDHLRPVPLEKHEFQKTTPLIPPIPPQPPRQRGISVLARKQLQDKVVTALPTLPRGLPTLSQVTRKVFHNKAMAGQPIVTSECCDRTRKVPPVTQNRHAKPVQVMQGQPTFERIVLPLPIRPLRLAGPAKAYLTTDMSTVSQGHGGVGRTEEKFGHPVHASFILPDRKESLPYRQMNSLAEMQEPRLKTLRRSVSFAGWNAAPSSGPSLEQDPVMQILRALRKDMP